jgi:hypothetical protein
MYEWLRYELSHVKYAGFFEVGSQCDLSTIRMAVPTSFAKFVEDFGEAKLYFKKGRFRIGILASPLEHHMPPFDGFVEIGWTVSSKVFFRVSEMNGDSEALVYEWFPKSGMTCTKVVFSEWLEKRAASIRRSSPRKVWLKYLEGPLPFTEEERLVLRARLLFSCDLVEAEPNARMKLRVRNGSDRTLPWLTVGVSLSRLGRFPAEIRTNMFVPTLEVAPMMVRDVFTPPDSEPIDPNSVKVFPLGNPSPRERDCFAELFRAVGGGS